MEPVTRPADRSPATLDEKRFELAVQLATAFVANGDIRKGHSLHKSQALQELEDLIPQLYQMLGEARAECVLGHPTDD